MSDAAAPQAAASQSAASRATTEAAIVEAPALRWTLVDGGGKPFGGATVTLQGPRSTDLGTVSDEERWADSESVTIADNQGQAGYAGADLDPAPGAFVIERYAAEGNSEQTDVVDGSDYRIRAEDAGGFLTGEDAEWTAVAAGTDSDQAATVELHSAVASRSAGVAPLLAGPDGPGGTPVTGPYVYWTVKDAAGTLRGGASFTIQGPRDNGLLFPTWSSSEAVVVDNGPLDLDKDDGEFLVQVFDSHTIRDDRRYRIQQTSAPSGYRFTASSSWVSIDGDRRAPYASEWVNGRHDFGNFVVEKLPTFTPVCAAGTVYALSAGGQLQRVTGGVRTTVGSPAGTSAANGLGIGADGTVVYALERTNGGFDGTVLRFNTTNGTWASTGHSQVTDVGLVAGAVNLSTGAYVFGGFTDNGSQFKMWRYNPTSSAPRFTYLGYIQTNTGTTDNNGDMAFNSTGDLFVVHGTGSSVKIYGVTGANFNAANGGLIASSQSTSFTTTSSAVNGVAFDANGKAYLGNGSDIRSYDMPSWTNASLVTNALTNSTDLATCSSPATITVRKVVQGGRAAASDQFTLTLSQGNTTLGTATTSGSAIGVQPQIVGPLPAVRGATLTFSEAFANGASAANYATSYQCLVDGEPLSPPVAGSGTAGSVTIPNTGKQIVCDIVNTPLTASVTITKRVQDTKGQNESVASGWTVNAVPAATVGTIIRTPAAAQQTSASGTASWGLRFGTAASRATVSVSETQQSGYMFVSGTCVINHPTGDPDEITLTSAAATPLAGVAPGDRVECTYVNRQIEGAILWQKVTNDTPAANIAGSTFTVQGPGASGATLTVADCVGATAAACATAADKDHRAGYLKVAGLAWGTYTVTETVAPAGFVLDATPRTVIINAANAQLGATLSPVSNTRKLGSVIWSKVDAADSTMLLGGSSWTIAGPGFTAAGNVVDDCIAANDAACVGLDKDARAGRFRLAGLAWGNYAITESVAPLGYVRDTTPHTFSIDAANAGTEVSLGAIKNSLATPPSLPLTGGLGSDFYSLLGLGTLILAGLLWITRRVWTRHNGRTRGGPMTV